jgi:hypothetical protein
MRISTSADDLRGAVLSEVFPEYGDYMARMARLLPGVY